MPALPTNDEVFPWSKSFETNIPIVDKQHRKLVELLNLMAIKLAQESDPIALDQVFDELAAYIDYHFRTEEGVWQGGFREDEWAIRHRNAHAGFVSKVAELKKEAKSGAGQTVYERTLRFLISWLAHHILDDDMRMAKAMHALDDGLSLEEAKERTGQEMSDSIEIFIDNLLGMYGNLSTRTMELMQERLIRSRVEDELRRREQNEREFNDKIITSIPGLVYLYNEQNKLVRWNKNMVSEFGYSENELKGKSPLDFFASSKHERITNELASLAAGEQVELEEEVQRRDGSQVPYLLTGVPLEIEGKHCFLGTGIDISKLKLAEQELEEKSVEIKDALLGTIVAVSRAMEARDPYTAGHQQRVATISVAIAEKLGLDENRIEGLHLGASIHDIGKLAVPAEILVKPTRLTPLEDGIVRSHVEVGAEILKDVRFPWPIVDIVAQHHERLDGSGYPRGLKGNKICMEARIVAVADVFEAMSSHRPYRPSLGSTPALAELNGNRGKKYDPSVIDALQQLLKDDANVFATGASAGG